MLLLVEMLYSYLEIVFLQGEQFFWPFIMPPETQFIYIYLIQLDTLYNTEYLLK